MEPPERLGGFFISAHGLCAFCGKIEAPVIPTHFFVITMKSSGLPTIPRPESRLFQLIT
jgi:hypothetical protein